MNRLYNKIVNKPYLFWRFFFLLLAVTAIALWVHASISIGMVR